MAALGKRIEMTASHRLVLASNLAFVGERMAAEEVLVRERLLATAPELEPYKAKLVTAKSNIKECKARLNTVSPSAPTAQPTLPLYVFQRFLFFCGSLAPSVT